MHPHSRYTREGDCRLKKFKIAPLKLEADSLSTSQRKLCEKGRDPVNQGENDLRILNRERRKAAGQGDIALGSRLNAKRNREEKRPGAR
jgi:hypothetical protein